VCSEPDAEDAGAEAPAYIDGGRPTSIGTGPVDVGPDLQVRHAVYVKPMARANCAARERHRSRPRLSPTRGL
jgi:hypothetical protein